jgi:hypothetical protein
MYGTFVTPNFAYSQTLYNVDINPSDPDGPFKRTDSGWYNYYSQPLIYISRSGTNREDPLALPNASLTKLRTVQVKKKVGWKFKVKTESYWVYDEKSRKALKKFRRTVKRVAVFIKVKTFVPKRVRVKKTDDSVMKPNALLFTSYRTFIAPEINTFHVVSDPGSLYERSAAMKTRGLPNEFALKNHTGAALSSPRGWPSAPSYDYTDYSSVIPSDDLRDRALNKLYNKVGSEFPDYMTDVAEISQTFATIRKIAINAILLVRDIKHLDAKRLSGEIKGLTPKKLANLWLEYIYGVAPVLQDIEDSVELFRRSSRTWRSYSTSATETTVTHNSSAWPATEGSHPFFIKDEVRKVTTTIRFGAIMVGDSSFARYSGKVNSLDGAASLAYEVIPYSFMLDWIYNLGQYLHDREIFDTNLLYAWKTTLIKEEVISTFRVNNSEPSVARECTPFTVQGTRVYCNREILDTIPAMPTPKVKRAKELFSWARALNALALLIQKG